MSQVDSKQVDLLFVAKNRKRFTCWSLHSLIENTNWDLVRKAFLYDDGSVDGTDELMQAMLPYIPSAATLERTDLGSPIAVTNDFLGRAQAQFFAKIDNDAIVPPKWLDISVALMNVDGALEVLGLEWRGITGEQPYRPDAADHVGGLYLARKSIFDVRERPIASDIYSGWGEFQQKFDINRAWIHPSIPVFLLDRIPEEPFSGLSKEYISKGWQRPWFNYEPGQSSLWKWWADTRSHADPA